MHVEVSNNYRKEPVIRYGEKRAKEFSYQLRMINDICVLGVFLFSSQMKAFSSRLKVAFLLCNHQGINESQNASLFNFQCHLDGHSGSELDFEIICTRKMFLCENQSWYQTKLLIIGMVCQISENANHPIYKVVKKYTPYGQLLYSSFLILAWKQIISNFINFLQNELSI